MKWEAEWTRDRFKAAPCCEACGEVPEAGLAPHHVVARGHGGGRHLDIAINLVSLCLTCHNRTHTEGRPSQAEMFDLVAKRECIAPYLAREIIDEILRTPGKEIEDLPPHLQPYLERKPEEKHDIAVVSVGPEGAEIDIDGVRYTVTAIPSHPGVASEAWEVAKHTDGTIYHVHRDSYRLHCTCGDFVFRKTWSPNTCKHVQALIDHNLTNLVKREIA